MTRIKPQNNAIDPTADKPKPAFVLRWLMAVVTA